MKVYIGKYKNGITPWSISRKLLFFLDSESQIVDNLGDILAFGKIKKIPKDSERLSFPYDEFLRQQEQDRIDYPETKFYKFLQKLNSLNKRINYIHIDDYDVWNLDETLASIIYPLLVKYKEQKNGSPFVDNEDVPEELRNTNKNKYKDDTVHERWDYVINEILYSFTPEVVEEYMDYDMSEEDKKRFNKGRILFGKYMIGMWT